MNTAIWTWPDGDIGNGGQNNLGDLDDKIALNLQFCQECVCGWQKKVIQKLTIHNIEQSKQFTGTLNQEGIWTLFQLRIIAWLMEFSAFINRVY